MKDAHSCANKFTEISTKTMEGPQEDTNQVSPWLQLKPHKLLIAASKVIEQCETQQQNCNGNNNDNHKERIRYLSSIIDTLDAKTIGGTTKNTNNHDNPPLNYTVSAVYAHAYALRAQTHIELNHMEAAIHDAQNVISLSTPRRTMLVAGLRDDYTPCVVTASSLTKAFRAMIDAELLRLEEDSKLEYHSNMEYTYNNNGMNTVSALQQRRQP